MTSIVPRTMRIFSLFTLSVVGIFMFAQFAFAGTLTNFSFSSTDLTPGATADYTFTYTVETADPNMILYINWPAGFDVGGSSASVTINGTPATINEFAKFSTLTYIRLDTGASPVASGAEIVTTISGIVNASTAGTYNFGFVHTADGGGNAIDTPASLGSLMIEGTFAGGNGTVGNPYQISSCTQLENMNDYPNDHFILIQNINCSDSASWNAGEGFDPVGDMMVPFTGSFNGAGYVISNLTINRPAVAGVGLFGATGNGVTLRNIWLDNVSITGGQNTGAIVGNLGINQGIRSLLETSYAQGTVTGTSSSVGGLVGSAYSLDLENSYFRGTVTADVFDVGGLTGYTEELGMINTYFVGTVASTNNTPYALVGWLAGTSPSITNAFWDIDVSGPINLTNGADDSAGLSTAIMKTESNFTSAGWDFLAVWTINGGINDGYPILRAPGDVEIILDGEGTEETPWRVTQCMTLRDSGYYVLINDINDVEGDCIVIGADDIEFDGDDHTITGFETLGDQAIDSDGYDQIRIRNVELVNFEDGIQLWDSEGPSSVVNSTITNMRDDGIEGLGMRDFRVSNNTISIINDDGIDTGPYDDGEYIENTDITITENIISLADSTGIELSYATGVVIRNNTISDGGNDGIYIEDVSDASLESNLITDVNADGIDIDTDSDDDATNVEVIGNTIISPGDAGIEISSLQNGIIRENTITRAGDEGIDLNNSTQVTITENTITAHGEGIMFDGSSGNTVTENTISMVTIEALSVPQTSFEFVAVNAEGATPANAGDVITDFGDYTLSTDDDYFQYDLPFTFNYHGRDITRISVSTNGSVELLETGEYCGGGSSSVEGFAFDCNDRGSYQALLTGDVLLANMDDLDFGRTPGDYLGVFNIGDDQVVIEWYGITYTDGGDDLTSATNPIHFQIVLRSDGRIEWNMNQLQYQNYSNDFFSGAYDGEAEELYVVGFGLTEDQKSYSGDFSGAGTFSSLSIEQPFTALEFNDATNNTLTGNFLTATTWVESDTDGNIFNTASTGNTYYLSSGLGAWTQFDIADTDNNGFADAGSDRPFSQATVGAYWVGNGQDAYPATLTKAETEKIVSVGRIMRTVAPAAPAGTTPTLGQPGTCSADQTLTQNLRAPSRNGRYNSYTKGIVTQAKILQAHLNRLGFNSGPEDGILGPISTGAIKRMQTFLGTKADGFVGPITRGLLNNSCGATTR